MMGKARKHHKTCAAFEIKNPAGPWWHGGAGKQL